MKFLCAVLCLSCASTATYGGEIPEILEKMDRIAMQVPLYPKASNLKYKEERYGSIDAWEATRDPDNNVCKISSSSRPVSFISFEWDRKKQDEILIYHYFRSPLESVIYKFSDGNFSLRTYKSSQGNITYSAISLKEFSKIENLFENESEVSVAYQGTENVEVVSMEGFASAVVDFKECQESLIDYKKRETPKVDYSLVVDKIEFGIKAPQLASALELNDGYWRYNTLVDLNSGLVLCLLTSEQGGYNFRIWKMRGYDSLVAFDLADGDLNRARENRFDTLKITTSNERRYNFESYMTKTSAMARIPGRDVGPMLNAIYQSRTIWAEIANNEDHIFMELEADRLNMLIHFADCVGKLSK